MMYRVIKEFVDLKDNRHKYVVGDVYPHHGGTVNEDRIKELSGHGNMARVPLIQEEAEEGLSLTTGDALEAGSGVDPTSPSKRKEKPRRKQGKYARTDS